MDAVIAVSDHLCSGSEPQRLGTSGVILEPIGHCANSDGTKAQHKTKEVIIIKISIIGEVAMEIGPVNHRYKRIEIF